MQKQIEERYALAKILAENFTPMAFGEHGELLTYDESDFEWCAFQAIEAGYRKQEWISVEERLPEDERQVLVCGMRGRVCVCRYESRYDKNFRGIRTGFYRNEDKKFMNVRYWMPLPEPPKGGTDANY